jgi:ATP-independent RNA helicase DbpA
MNLFSTIDGLKPNILKALDDLHFKNMTPIQELSIKEILLDKDIIAKAKTGSGKTLAFIIPALNKIELSNRKPQVLIIVPTRELCMQIVAVTRDMAKYNENFKVASLYGGVKLYEQTTYMQNGTHMIVATPGRLKDHLDRGNVDLSDIHMLILDEADKMLDMGFYDEIVSIIKRLEREKQTLLFSATLAQKVLKLADAILKNPLLLAIDTAQKKIEEFFMISNNLQEDILKIILYKSPSKAILFCNTKEETYELEALLKSHHISSALLNGDLDQTSRNEALIQLSNGSIRILVATDIASRGLDVDDIDMVLNYKLPEKKEIYTHRIGRSARAEKSGEAISIFTKSQKGFFDQLSENHNELTIDTHRLASKLPSTNITFVINGGKRDKISPKDILGALIKDAEIAYEHIGNITIHERKSYIAIKNGTNFSHKNLRIKGKNRKIWTI